MSHTSFHKTENISTNLIFVFTIYCSWREVNDNKNINKREYSSYCLLFVLQTSSHYHCFSASRQMESKQFSRRCIIYTVFSFFVILNFILIWTVKISWPDRQVCCTHIIEEESGSFMNFTIEWLLLKFLCIFYYSKNILKF